MAACGREYSDLRNLSRRPSLPHQFPLIRIAIKRRRIGPNHRNYLPVQAHVVALFNQQQVFRIIIVVVAIQMMDMEPL